MLVTRTNVLLICDCGGCTSTAEATRSQVRVDRDPTASTVAVVSELLHKARIVVERNDILEWFDDGDIDCLEGWSIAVCPPSQEGGWITPSSSMLSTHCSDRCRRADQAVDRLRPDGAGDAYALKQFARVVKAPTVSPPSYGFSADNNTGFQRSDLRISTGTGIAVRPSMLEVFGFAKNEDE